MLTPYQFAGDQPIWAIDLDGLEPYPMTSGDYIGFLSVLALMTSQEVLNAVPGVSSVVNGSQEIMEGVVMDANAKAQTDPKYSMVDPMTRDMMVTFDRGAAAATVVGGVGDFYSGTFETGIAIALILDPLPGDEAVLSGYVMEEVTVVNKLSWWEKRRIKMNQRTQKQNMKLEQEIGSKMNPGALNNRMQPKMGSAGGPGASRPFSKSVKNGARVEAENQCVFCGRETTRESGPTQSNIDHAIPKIRGGNNTPENAQNTCRDCNLSKGTKTTEEYLQRKK